ncbi:PilZ domain-containing protein [Sporomusa sp.]|uniref:RraA family protein n=1 Tax=Sporomusa sp. TaxID=2078658 RepID=UPI002D7F3AA3|nr:PilZ domain-containing protein [Sporomusa sp.]
MSRAALRIFTQINRPSRALLDSFSRIPTANIAHHLHRRSCMNSKIRPLNDIPLVGPAITVTSRAGGTLMLHKALDIAQPGDIIVVDAQGDLTYSVMGELMALWAKQRGIGGFVIDGAIRNAGTLKKMDMSIYAAGANPAGPYTDGSGEINIPVTCGGVVVYPGDILVGDEDGIVVINPKHAPTLLEKCLAETHAVIKATEEIANKLWDRTWIDQALKQRDVIIENRKFPRIDIEAPVTIKVNGSDQHLHALALNISMDGILLQIKEHFDINLPILLSLPKELGNLKVAARVAWQQDDHIGCRFADMPEEDARAIFDLIWYLHRKNNPGLSSPNPL